MKLFTILVDRGARAAEAQTLLNMALALWQLGDFDRAYENYIHAYRAAEAPSAFSIHCSLVH